MAESTKSDKAKPQDWKQVLYTEDRVKKWAKGEMTLAELDGIVDFAENVCRSIQVKNRKVVPATGAAPGSGSAAGSASGSGSAR